MGLYLGLLGAARVSRAVLATDEGKIVAHILAPPLTIRVNAKVSLHLRQTFERLAKVGGTNFEAMVNDLRGACIAMSGVYLESDRAALKQVLHKIGFSGPFRLVTCEDSNAHLAANSLTYGAVVMASTGSNVFLRGHGMMNPIRVDGWGSVIGDEGGGYDLGIKCLQAVLKGIDGRMTQSSMLENKLLHYIGLSSIEDIIPWYYNVHETIRWRSDIADLAIPLIDAAERDNDKIARQIVMKAALLLRNSLQVAIESATELRDKFSPEPVPLVLEGGLFRHSEIYVETFTSWLSSRPACDIQWKVVRPKYQPVVGALALALSGEPYLEGELAKYDSIWGSAEEERLQMKNDILSRHEREHD